jgi:hypothetical protein
VSRTTFLIVSRPVGTILSVVSRRVATLVLDVLAGRVEPCREYRPTTKAGP